MLFVKELLEFALLFEKLLPALVPFAFGAGIHERLLQQPLHECGHVLLWLKRDTGLLLEALCLSLHLQGHRGMARGSREVLCQRLLQGVQLFDFASEAAYFGVGLLLESGEFGLLGLHLAFQFLHASPQQFILSLDLLCKLWTHFIPLAK